MKPTPVASTPVGSQTQAERETETEPTVVTLGDAMESTGMICSGSGRSKECEWDGIVVGLVIPQDWGHDAIQRSQACPDGDINVNHNIVPDGATWHLAADFDSENTALVEALDQAGLSATILKYCP